MRQTAMRSVLLNRVAGTVAALVLSGCAATPKPGISMSAYSDARDALDTGDYAGAVSRYGSLLPQAGDDRIGIAVRLELAHALLRAHEPERALTVARDLEALDLDPATYANVKLVAAVAEHERAERAVASNSPYDEARVLARDALRSMDAIVRGHPQYDPEDVLIPRIREVRETLAELEIAQLRLELQKSTNSSAATRAAYIEREFSDTVAAADALELLRRARSAR